MDLNLKRDAGYRKEGTFVLNSQVVTVNQYSIHFYYSSMLNLYSELWTNWPAGSASYWLIQLSLYGLC